MAERSRRLDYLRGPEVQAYLARSDAAILAFGPTETHGTHLPLGTDYLISLATAELAARKADALVLPPFPYSWPGATAKLPGTMRLPPDLVQRTVVAILGAAVAQGFRRLATICAHGPDVHVATLAGRQAFEEYGVHVAVHHAVPGRGTTERERGLAEPLLAHDRDDPGRGETSRLIAALEMLGLPADLVDTTAPAARGAAQAAALTEPMRSGGAGFYYSELSQHIPTPRERDVDAARAYLDASAAAVAQS
ncbi:MAG TPA: creatininase family protein, partial [Chloroflexota bacterium]|nr:creatininase family protein [Chloroflexota bacterium]